MLQLTWKDLLRLIEKGPLEVMASINRNRPMILLVSTHTPQLTVKLDRTVNIGSTR